LIGDETMLQATVRRLQPLIPPERILVLTNAEYVYDVVQQLPELPPEHIIGEPEAIGTAPAAGLGAAVAAAEDPQATVVVLPADHVISPVEELHAALLRAAEAARDGWLVTFGLVPAFPATGYGYIEVGEEHAGASTANRVVRFVEKPDLDDARRYVADGRYYWNSGMFAWRVDAFAAECRRLLPRLADSIDDMVQLARGPACDFSRHLPQLWAGIEDRTTIDYGIMESSDNVACVMTKLEWSDVGSWAALHGLLPEDSDGNVIVGEHIGLDTSSCIVYGRGDRVIATLGVDDLVIVDTPDALLVCQRDKAQDVKRIVEALRESGRTDLL
jgi:mannose-1-phosphate guanylyltransferase